MSPLEARFNSFFTELFDLLEFNTDSSCEVKMYMDDEASSRPIFADHAVHIAVARERANVHELCIHKIKRLGLKHGVDTGPFKSWEISNQCA